VGMVVEMMCEVYFGMVLFVFVFLILVLVFKYEGMRPLVGEVESKLPEFGVDIVVFPYLVLMGIFGMLLSIRLNNSIPAIMGILMTTALASILAARLKYQRERFIRFSMNLKERIILVNTLILGLMSVGMLKLLCRKLRTSHIIGIIPPLVVYALLSIRYLHNYKTGNIQEVITW